ncbi:MAG TPA: respiratory nitrate reductase subunit gamma [Candidatus Dormibacteraeota bacterium]
MRAADVILWVILPYAALVLFVAGHVWRYRHDQFGWTSRSTQLLESRWLAWGSNLFHYGALAAIAGHVLGMLVPSWLTSAVGVSEEAYHVLSAVAGSVAGLVCVAGFVILAARRAYFPRVRRTTSPTDVAVYVLLAAVIGLGIGETLVFSAFGGGYDYRATVAVWFRGIFVLDPRPDLMASAPLVYQVHAASAWLLYALWPFSRLVHVWSLPLQYLGRPYILYRSRYAPGRR